MPSLDSDVSYALVKEALALYRDIDLTVVLNLASTCRILRQTCLAALFADVNWPHGSKHDEESGLLFFPPTLWPFFRRFRLLWPEDWPETTPPRWGDRYYLGGDYHPRHIDKLVAALPAMPSLTSFFLRCPFFPPNSILNALIQCPSLRELSINDTPLYVSMIPKVPAEFHLENLVIVPVAEAVRVGEGPFDARYAEHTYYVREFRKRYKNDILARYTATAFLLQVGKAEHLKSIQLSTGLCTLDTFAEQTWPVLETLILTGHAPRGNIGFLDVIVKMPRLQELRLLFAKTKGDPAFHMLPDQLSTDNVISPNILGRLKRLAMSNACNFDRVLHYTSSLERLAICAIIDQPRVPIAMSRADVEKILADMAVGQQSSVSRLMKLRVMIEDKVHPDLCRAIALRCPNLEALEIELCGYHDGKSIHAWEEFQDAFSTLTHLQELRICIQFPEFDEMDTYEPWRAARKECAKFLAGRIETLRRVGFEYRKRTGTHRFQDSWLEFDVERSEEAEGVELFELGPSWYPFPEVWVPVLAGNNVL